MKRPDIATLDGLKLASFVIAVAIIVMLTSRVWAIDNGQFENVDPNVRSWFKSIRSPNGVPCCDMADGHRTTSKQATRTQEEIAAGMSEWWVPIAGEWVQVPEAAVVYNAGNPIGEAVVWYVPYNDAPHRFHVRCFVPGGGV